MGVVEGGQRKGEGGQGKDEGEDKGINGIRTQDVKDTELIKRKRKEVYFKSLTFFPN